MFRVLLLSLISSTTFMVAATQPQPFRRPLVFEPNRGQAPAQVGWIARGPGYQLLLTSEGVTMTVREGAAGSASAKPKYSTVQMKLTGSRPWKDVTGLQPTGGVSNYLGGTDAKNSLNGIPNYARVSVAGVYDGVDLVLYDHGGDLEYDFIVKPGADPKKIQLAFEGAQGIRVDEKSGDLILTTAAGSELRQLRPKMYQEVEARRVEVAGRYQLLDRAHAAFTVAPYDPRLPLVIDPTVSFTSFFVGSSEDFANAVAVDSNGNTYVAGGTSSHNFPVTNGTKWEDCKGQGLPFPQFCVAPDNIFVIELSPTGTILYSTYGGVGFAGGIAVDSTGVYITGGIRAPNVDNPIGFAGGLDVFVSKLSPTGSQVYFHIFGYSDNEWGNAIAVDSQHNAWVAGVIYSAERIGRTGPNQSDAYVTKFGPAGEFGFEGVFGNSGVNSALAITVDPADQPWVTGTTCGDNFPTTDGISHPANGCSVFAMQLTTAGNTRMSMIFGGSTAGDAGTGVVSNGSNSAYVAGTTNSANFPTTAGSFQTVRTSTGSQAFVSQVESSTGVGRIIHSTLLGADGNTTGSAIASVIGGVYVAGNTTSSQMPGAPALTPNPTAGFVSKLSFNLTQLSYTKLLGAGVLGVAVTKPAAAPAVPEIYAAGYRYTGTVEQDHIDAFVVKMDDDVAQSQVLWDNPGTGELSAWLLNDQGVVTGVQAISRACGTSDGCSQNWKVIGTLDFNRDGVGDVLSYNASTGELQAWLLNSTGAVTGTQTLSRRCGTSDGCSQNWKPVGVGDFNHDGISDILWHSQVTGVLEAWLLNPAGDVAGTLDLSHKCAVQDGCWGTWQIVGIGDFNDDGIDDFFWYKTTTGQIDVGLMDSSGNETGSQWLAKVCGPSDGCSANWKAVGLADVNQDGLDDLLWENPTTGELQAWLMNGTDRIVGVQTLSMRCGSSSGCSQGSIPVGILRNH